MPRLKTMVIRSVRCCIGLLGVRDVKFSDGWPRQAWRRASITPSQSARSYPLRGIPQGEISEQVGNLSPGPGSATLLGPLNSCTSGQGFRAGRHVDLRRHGFKSGRRILPELQSSGRGYFRCRRSRPGDADCLIDVSVLLQRRMARCHVPRMPPREVRTPPEHGPRHSRATGVSALGRGAGNDPATVSMTTSLNRHGAC